MEESQIIISTYLLREVLIYFLLPITIKQTGNIIYLLYQVASIHSGPHTGLEGMGGGGGGRREGFKHWGKV